jgi:uncharacterized membrane protein
MLALFRYLTHSIATIFIILLYTIYFFTFGSQWIRNPTSSYEYLGYIMIIIFFGALDGIPNYSDLDHDDEFRKSKARQFSRHSILILIIELYRYEIVMWIFGLTWIYGIIASALWYRCIKRKVTYP